MVSLLLVGLGMLLEAISGYVCIGYGASQGLSVTTGDGVWIALDTLLLLISFLTIIASMSVSRGAYPQKMVMGVLLFAVISLFVQGGGMLAISTSSSSWVSAAALAIAAGVVLLIGLFALRGPSLAMRFTGAIFTLAFTVLLMARLAALGGAPGGGYSLSSYILAPFYYYYGYYIVDLGSSYTSLGILGFTYLVLVAYLVVALGLLIYTILQKSRLAPLAWVVALTGFLLYGIDMAWGNIAALANANWTYVSHEVGYAVTPLIAAVVLAVAAFVVMAASIIGMVFYGGGLAGMALAQPSMAQTQPSQMVAGTFCPSCGAQNPADHAFCKKCGAKLG
jgi:ribosomal protein L40E